MVLSSLGFFTLDRNKRDLNGESIRHQSFILELESRDEFFKDHWKIESVYTTRWREGRKLDENIPYDMSLYNIGYRCTTQSMVIHIIISIGDVWR